MGSSVTKIISQSSKEVHQSRDPDKDCEKQDNKQQAESKCKINEAEKRGKGQIEDEGKAEKSADEGDLEDKEDILPKNEPERKPTAWELRNYGGYTALARPYHGRYDEVSSKGLSKYLQLRFLPNTPSLPQLAIVSHPLEFSRIHSCIL